MSETKGTSHPYEKSRKRYVGNLTETKETQNMQNEYIKKLKTAFQAVLKDVMLYWDNDSFGHSQKAREAYAEEIKLCGLEVDDG